MKITGTATLTAPVERVWSAVTDPAVLARTLPGCESLTETGPDAYAVRVTAGVAAVKGTYDGTVSLSDKASPTSFTMRAEGAGAPGTIAADVRVRLMPSATGGTDLTYDADATVGGMVGGVGQRMLLGVTRKMAGEFFAAVDADIAGGEPGGVASSSATYAPARGRMPRASVTYGPGVEDQTGPRTFPGRAASATANANLTMDRGSTFALGAAVGGLLALAGVAVGARIARRH